MVEKEDTSVMVVAGSPVLNLLVTGDDVTMFVMLCMLNASTKGAAKKSTLAKHIAKNNNMVDQLLCTLDKYMPVHTKVA